VRQTMVAVIIGCGVAGAATAHYISKLSPNQQITIIDPRLSRNSSSPTTTLNGGFLDREAFLSESWGDGTATERLHRSSFRLHETLSKELGLKSFRYLPAFEVNIEQKRTNAGSTDAADADALPWIDGWERTPLPGRSAQVNPSELTKALLDLAVEKGAELVAGAVEELCTQRDEDGAVVTGVRLSDGSVIHADSVVIAAGVRAGVPESRIGAIIRVPWKGSGRHS